MQRSFATNIVGFFLSALLPPRDDDEPSFYDILGLEASATADELRKAYRKLSLKFHPDKIAQRYGGDSKKKEEAAAEYEKIQEAYHVLIDEKKRIKYDSLGSPTRYRFIDRHGYTDPQALYENLAGASVTDKSRLVGPFFIAVLLLLMQPILIAAKINQSLEGEGPLAASTWVSIMIPYWVTGILFVILTFVTAVFVPKGDRLPVCLSGVEQFCWYLGVLFLCYKWDETWNDSVPYRKALVPVYVAMVFRWLRSLVIIRKVRLDVNRMVSTDYIQNELLKERSMDELSEEEQKEIMEAFLVISVDPDFVLPDDGEFTDEELEELKVESSPEYEAATEIYYTTVHGLIASLFFGSIFFILLTLKLDDRLNSGADWWAVFSPFWIERGGRLLLNLYKCCCAGVVGEEIVLYEGVDLPTATDDAGEQESKEGKAEEEASQKEAVTQTFSAAKSTEASQTDVCQEKNVDVVKEGGENTKYVDDAKKDNSDSGSIGKSKGKNVGLKAVSSNSQNDNDGVGKDGDGDVGSNENTDDDSDGINIDEETFNAWQSAYQEANKDAKQKRAESISESFSIIFQLVLLCLVVAKIEKNYDNKDPDDVGFNVFWILFPFFLFFGLILCCCVMVIFGARPVEMEGEKDEEEEQDPENPPVENDEKEGGVTIISVDPSTDVKIAVEPIVAPEKPLDEPATETSQPSDPPLEGNMEDLD